MSNLRAFMVTTLLLIHETATSADVAHFFTPDYNSFIAQQPFQFIFQQPPTPTQDQQQSSLPTLYGPPPPQSPQSEGGYPNPVTPTPAPVAPTQATTEFFVPEIVENRNAKEIARFIPLRNQYLPPHVEERPNYESPKPPNHGYYYPQPISSTTTLAPHPIVVMEPAEFLPPLNGNPIAEQPPFPGYDYNAPPPQLPPAASSSTPSTPAPVYLPPPSAFNGEEHALVPQTNGGHNSLRVRVKEMRCLQQYPGGGYFRAALKAESFLVAAPNVDNDSNDKRCELKLTRSYVIIDIAAEDFAKCGVRSCGKDLCLRLRFPAIRGMRTGADAILTLHCKTQERTAFKMHALKMGVANDIQARSIGTYAHGGIQNPLRTQIELLRKSRNGGFTHHLESSGVVQLGEELLLRAHVLPGDGWNYTKLTDVSLQRISPTGELLNTVNLVTTRGCVNPSMQSICNHPPIYEPPLGHRLIFKAVMFQGMHSGDEVIMSMRISACLEQNDCYIWHEECEGGHFGNSGRRRRDTVKDIESIEHKPTSNLTEVSEITHISFRVIMKDVNRTRVETKISVEDERATITLQPRLLILAYSLGFVTLLTSLGVIVAWKFKS